MNELIGIIGYGYVGKAVANGFSKIEKLICDPQYTDITIEQVCESNPLAVFVCVPTPSDGEDFAIVRSVLQQIKNTGYKGIVVVKSTVLPHVLGQYDVIFNPEFLSRDTAEQDFISPPYVIIGGPRGEELAHLYRTYTDVDMSNTYFVDIPTACMIKYTANAFYATKVTFMNAMKDVSDTVGADYTTLINILATNPRMGNDHFRVPGPDGQHGFGGPCLPKDTQALYDYYNVELLKTVLELNVKYRES